MFDSILELLKNKDIVVKFGSVGIVSYYFFSNMLKNLYKIGYAQKKFVRLSFLSFLIFLLITLELTDLTEFKEYNRVIYSILLVILKIMYLILIYCFLSLIQLISETISPKTELQYANLSVKNNNIDNCIWCACTSGQLIKIITKSNEEFIVFPKYSSSYDCKLTIKKYLRAFILKKGIIDNNGKVEYYEDNTRQILQKADLLIQRNNDQNSLFEEIKIDSTENKKWAYKPYPKVLFYQILSEFEDRIDFKDIVSISIYHPECNKND